MHVCFGMVRRWSADDKKAVEEYINQFNDMTRVEVESREISDAMIFTDELF